MAIAALRRLIGLNMLMAMFAATSPVAADPLSGHSLYDDVRRYDGFGAHRYGSPGAAQAFDWIVGELARSGFSVSSQNFVMGRQYDFHSGSIVVEGKTVLAVQHWWIERTRCRGIGVKG